ncbi:aconitase iron-sulfur domain-containing protein, partial [Aspergillus ibericus CBS 121593]
ADEGAEYDGVIEVDLSRLEARINGPFTPDLSTPVGRLAEVVEEGKWPRRLTAGLIGSCTNSSFEDMGRAASVARQALEVGLKPKMPLLVSPGSLQTRDTLEEAGVLAVFEELGATMLPNACGPCCGSWDRVDMPKVSAPWRGLRISIITSYNRNFSGRLDSNPATNFLLASPELVMAKDTLTTPSGEEFRFQPPTGDTLPKNGYLNSDAAYKAPPADRSAVEVEISPTSDRLQRLAPFAPWSGNDFHDCPWFRYRGHLENISNNTLIGAVNAENGLVNTVRNQLTQEDGDVPGTARDYKAKGQPWVVIADHNYGEGSSREHAALQPRYLGGVAIIAKSFARIHEANLKKQGMLALTFVDEADYDRMRAEDRVSIVGLEGLEPGNRVKLVVNGEWEAQLNHTFTGEQIEYFKAGISIESNNN